MSALRLLAALWIAAYLALPAGTWDLCACGPAGHGSTCALGGRDRPHPDADRLRELRTGTEAAVAPPACHVPAPAATSCCARRAHVVPTTISSAGCEGCPEVEVEVVPPTTPDPLGALETAASELDAPPLPAAALAAALPATPAPVHWPPGRLRRHLALHVLLC